MKVTFEARITADALDIQRYETSETASGTSSDSGWGWITMPLPMGTRTTDTVEAVLNARGWRTTGLWVTSVVDGYTSFVAPVAQV